MARSRDPIEVREEGSRDLYGIVNWEPRSLLDRISVVVYSLLLSGFRLFVVSLAILILAVQVALGGIGALTNPLLGAFTLLSIVPAFILALYVWYADVTTDEPLELLVATFALGVLFAGFAGVSNTVISSTFAMLGTVVGTFAVLGEILFFYLVVGPVEEAVKLLSVRLYAYRSSRFDAVIDGAVYGAVAGLGFATIENAIYISQATTGSADPQTLLLEGGAVATVRALAGPGHVIYSAFAGYYLGLAKFNRDRAGPIVVKGLLVAAFIHGTYNSLATFLPDLVANALSIPWFFVFIGFVIVYDGLFIYLLIRRLSAYRQTYHDVHESAADEGPTPELTEFDG